MNERISRGPQQAVRDDAPPGVRDNRGRGRREVPIDDLAGNKETALLLKMPDSRVGPETAFLQGERRRILSAAMANLTPRIRRATELRELDELSTSPSCPSHAGERARCAVGSSSTRGGTPAYLAPYFAAKAEMEVFSMPGRRSINI